MLENVFIKNGLKYRHSTARERRCGVVDRVRRFGGNQYLNADAGQVGKDE